MAFAPYAVAASVLNLLAFQVEDHEEVGMIHMINLRSRSL